MRSDGGPPPGYTIVSMQWSGPITPGGPDVKLEGTIQVCHHPYNDRRLVPWVLTYLLQEVHAQILKLNPEYKMVESANTTKRDLGIALEKRNKVVPPWCNPPGIGQASTQATHANYQYLNGLVGSRCGVGGGPRVCSRIACTQGGGVFLCNDVTLKTHHSTCLVY